jgi:alpha-L-fucosidase
MTIHEQARASFRHRLRHNTEERMHLDKHWLVLSYLLFGALGVPAQYQPAPRPSQETIRQWQGRKYGMFIHFGLFSVLGGVWKGKEYAGNYSEQIQSDAHIPENEYAALAAQFDPAQWDAEAVVKLAEEAGMKFIVLTAKHHDGFNMFETKQTSYNVVDATPYKRDIVKSLADACRRHGMPFGVYYSTIDWHWGDIPNEKNDNPISPAHEAFNAAQLQELLSNYGALSEIWFDMGHPTVLQSYHFAETVHRLQPECMISGRIWNSEGDFSETGDDDIPDYISDEPWEAPASIFQETWGYRSWQKHAPVEEKIREHILRLVKVTSRGGNYLLNIGPKGDGSVVDYEAEVLRGTGQWLHKYGEAIYDTSPQPFRKLDLGYATVKGNHLYLFVEHLPPDGRLRLPGMENRIQEAHWLAGEGRGKLQTEDSTVTVSRLPAQEFLPVIDVRFEGELRVQPAVTEPDGNDTIHLAPADAEKFFNNNGEGYYDPPTLRSEKWHFAVKRAGKYKIAVTYKRGPFSRVIDIKVGGKLVKANLYGTEALTASAGEVDLQSSKDMTISIAPGSPAVRGAKLDLEITGVSIAYGDR